MYIGIRIHTGGSTPDKRTHEEIYQWAIEPLAAIDDRLQWKHRTTGGFWSIFADIPTGSGAELLNEEEYLETIIDLSLDGWIAVKDLWLDFC